MYHRLTGEQEHDVLAAAWRLIRVSNELPEIVVGIRFPAALRNLKRVLSRVDPQEPEDECTAEGAIVAARNWAEVENRVASETRACDGSGAGEPIPATSQSGMIDQTNS